MPYSRRIPPIKIKLSVDDYNKLVQILDNMIDCGDEKYSSKSSKMKEKLLRYSVPIVEDDGIITVDIRFYNNEMVDLFKILFYGVGDIDIYTNFFDVLVKVREKIKEEKMTNE